MKKCCHVTELNWIVAHRTLYLILVAYFSAGRQFIGFMTKLYPTAWAAPKDFFLEERGEERKGQQI
jgi:hypothetical protein